MIGATAANTIVDPNSPSGTIVAPNASPYNPVYYHSHTTAILTASYAFVLPHKIHMEVGLTVNNLFDYTKPIHCNTIQRPPGGDVTNPGSVATPYSYWLFAPRNYMLASKVTF